MSGAEGGQSKASRLESHMDAVRDKGVYLCLELIGSYGSDVSTASENPVPGATVANTSRILEVKCSSRYEIWKTFCGIFSDSYGKIMSGRPSSRARR